MNLFITTLAFISLLVDHLHGAFALDNNYHITSSKPLFPNQTLISPSRIFELGFFRPHNTSDNQYIGIWYTNSTPFEVLWVANRSRPLPYSDRSSSLTIASDGNLKLLDGQGNIFWATNVSSSGDSSVTLSDSGNLVLSSGGSSLWESFDDPSDTLVQTMQVGTNVVTGKKKYLTSWKSDVDPSPGNFVFGITSDNPAQAFTWINGSIPYWRSGPWDSIKFSGIPEMIEAYISMFKVEQDTVQGTTYFSINRYNSTMLLYAQVYSNGLLQFKYTTNRTKGWILGDGLPANICEKYATCGPFGVCDILRSPICSCLQGFIPKSVEEWMRGNWTGGCKRATPLNCERNTSKQDMFLKMNHMKLPDSIYTLPALLSDPGNCSNWCLRNCSCLAYSYVNTIGCMTWSNQLVDIQKFSQRGADLYLRLAYIQTEEGPSRRLVISLTVVPIIFIILGAAVCRHRLRAKPERINSWKEQLKGEDGQVLPVFEFSKIVVATDNFSCENKLGQGGFGPVYKGELQDGKMVAVKRLSSNSRQGIEEFKTEILLISKLQHRNLVRLIGCCIEQEEKILIYEYLPNKSLDQFIFDPTKNIELNWEKRFQIIMGIARGLLYLHRDSHLRVIHRDLKASNVLLDENLKPKISDFGLARMFRGTQDLGNTRRVVGTFGYMAPEYAMRGIFSEKSDIYSFGVLMLEIVSRRRNTYFFYEEENVNLLSYTWRLWTQGRVLNLLDGEILESSSSSMVEVEKCVQVGLMCVQDQAINRPNMSCVIQMLSGELNLSEPKEPVFTIIQSDLPEQTPLHQERQCSGNTVTMSIVQGR